MKVNIEKFRNNLKDYLGKEIEITRYNKIIAILIPLNVVQDKLKEETKIIKPVQDNLTYGCGCKKTDKSLCPKHNRY